MQREGEFGRGLITSGHSLQPPVGVPTRGV